MTDIAPEYTPESQLSRQSKLAKLDRMYQELEDLQASIDMVEAELATP